MLQSLLEFITTRQLPGWLVVVLPHHWSRALAPVGGYLLAIIMALLTVLQSVLQQHFLYQSQQAAVRTATSIMSAVFSKSLRLSAEARANFESGEIINMIGGSERKREREKERERERERERSPRPSYERTVILTLPFPFLSSPFWVSSSVMKVLTWAAFTTSLGLRSTPIGRPPSRSSSPSSYSCVYWGDTPFLQD